MTYQRLKPDTSLDSTHARRTTLGRDNPYTNLHITHFNQDQSQEATTAWFPLGIDHLSFSFYKFQSQSLQYPFRSCCNLLALIPLASKAGEKRIRLKWNFQRRSELRFVANRRLIVAFASDSSAASAQFRREEASGTRASSGYDSDIRLNCLFNFTQSRRVWFDPAVAPIWRPPPPGLLKQLKPTRTWSVCNRFLSASS